MTEVKTNKSPAPSKKSILATLTPVLLVVSVGLAFTVGVLIQKVNQAEDRDVSQVAKKDDGEEQPADIGVEKEGQVAGEVEVTPPTRLETAKLPEEHAKTIGAIREDDHIRGSSESNIYLIEYADLECPFCKRFHETAKQLISEYEGKVAWVYRHFPLDTLHSKADKEAEAVECAGELGGNDGFWALTDKIYETTSSNNGLDLETLPNLAEDVGLDKDAFKTCLDSGRYADKVESDYQSGLASGVIATPMSFLVNDKGDAWILRGSVSLETLKSTIDEALQI